SCHATSFKQDRGQPASFSKKDGVSCDGCHGPAQFWLAEHFAVDEKGERAWRTLSPADKEARGMLDVRNPVKRAEMCMSCPVGSAAEGKIVTHSMYAAGHPPLPGFEVDGFSKNLPPHWRDLKDVPFLQKAPPKVQAQFGWDNRH